MSDDEQEVRPKLCMTSRELSFIMKRKNFVKDLDGWRKGFVFITAEDGQMKIGHSMEFKNGPLTNFEYEEMNEWIKYFERI